MRPYETNLHIRPYTLAFFSEILHLDMNLPASLFCKMTRKILPKCPHNYGHFLRFVESFKLHLTWVVVGGGGRNMFLKSK